jgi:hypothetical protein
MAIWTKCLIVCLYLSATDIYYHKLQTLQDNNKF